MAGVDFVGEFGLGKEVVVLGVVRVGGEDFGDVVGGDCGGDGEDEEEEGERVVTHFGERERDGLSVGSEVEEWELKVVVSVLFVCSILCECVRVCGVCFFNHGYGLLVTGWNMKCKSISALY